MRVLVVLLFLISAGESFGNADNLWVKKIGTDYYFGLKQYKGEYVFDDSNIYDFCERTKDYMSNYVPDYKKYQCKDGLEISASYCDRLREAFARQLEFDLPLGIEVGSNLHFSFVPNEINIEKLKTQVSYQYKTDKSNVIFSRDFEEEIKSDHLLIKKQPGFFTSVLNMLSTDPLVESSGYLGDGYTNNLYTACSIIAGESIVTSKKHQASKKYFEKTDNQQISLAWSLYENLYNYWNSDEIRKINNDLTRFLFLVEKIKTQMTPSLEKNFGGLEGVFNSFFAIEDGYVGIKIYPNVYSKEKFHETIFQPKKNHFTFDIEYVGGEKK